MRTDPGLRCALITCKFLPTRYKVVIEAICLHTHQFLTPIPNRRPMPTQDIDPLILDGVAADELSAFLAWREKVSAANISDKTLLATDYLNHFNEIVMLIEMLPDMPDMLEDCQMWRPKTYQEHFRDSGFSDKELAIDAYNYVPSKFRQPFEDSVEKLNQVVAHTLDRVAADVGGGDVEKLGFDCRASVELIHRIIQVLNGIIHGAAHVMEQGEIDAYLSNA